MTTPKNIASALADSPSKPPTASGAATATPRSLVGDSGRADGPTCENHPDELAEWPSTTADDGLCQACWEALCAREWWLMVERIDPSGEVAA